MGGDDRPCGLSGPDANRAERRNWQFSGERSTSRRLGFAERATDSVAVDDQLWAVFDPDVDHERRRFCVPGWRPGGQEWIEDRFSNCDEDLHTRRGRPRPARVVERDGHGVG